MAKFQFGKANPAAVAPTPIPESVILPAGKATEAKVQAEIERLNAEEALGNALLENSPPAPLTKTVEEVAEDSQHKLEQLVADDFPFDESQLEAINGIVAHRYACMTGAAGTGKTTSTKKIVQLLQDSVGAVDMREYFKRGSEDAQVGVDPDDDYEVPESYIPSIILCGFTGRSTQQIKGNFPRSWHTNIMTIHRLLAYMPEYFEDFDPETDEMKKTMRFVPTYTAENKLPWDIIIIDEAGMVGLDLWHNLFAALKDGCRVIMIGDINQLPPVHGKSIFGFALGSWPAWELTVVHRQAGVNNSIVDNAWRVINGNMPETDLSFKKHSIESKEGLVSFVNATIKEDWKFASAKIPEDIGVASQRVRQLLQVLNGRYYDPIRDSVITAINGHDESRGMQLGQLPLNQELAIIFNKSEARYIIDAGRERRRFAVGDKVMATRNDHEAGITNGMSGIITSIVRNAAYTGEWQRFGEVSEVAAWMEENGGEDEDEEFTLEQLEETHAAQEAGREAAKEKRDRGPASHIVTVSFGSGEHAFELPFGNLAEVASLMTAYVVTCHKMQGGEAPLVIIICHQSHKAMLFREWLYTAITRASARCLILYTELGLRSAIGKQKIKGTTMAAKVESFQALQKVGLLGAAVTVRLQKPEWMTGEPWVRTGQEVALKGAAHDAPVSPLLARLAAKAAERSAVPDSDGKQMIKAPLPKGVTDTPEVRQRMQDAVTREQPEEEFHRVVERVIVREIILDYPNRPVEDKKPEPKDGGWARPVTPAMAKFAESQANAAVNKIGMAFGKGRMLPPPPKPTHTPEQLREMAHHYTERFGSKGLLLTHQPAPAPVEPAVKVIKFQGLAALLAKGKQK